MRNVNVQGHTGSNHKGRTKFVPEEQVHVTTKPVGVWEEVEEEIELEDDIESGNEEGEIVRISIGENAQMSMDSVEVEEDKVIEDPPVNWVDVSNAQDVDCILSTGTEKTIPIHTVTSSPRGSAMIGEYGRMELEFDDISTVDRLLSDKGGAYTTVEKQHPGRLCRGGKK
ncbi:hypothetical protein NE237_019755 [Protea cynaroides]|uniref:Uncharacterized protein n=1 Tax=Protea cynaroides TaxID=273540 RepID=A0A9Q0H848_9MAGN|nr:hypothetical protein NE237_019755 [Protea cynaroides]